MKILIAVPTFETIFPDVFKAIYDLDTCGNEVIFEYIRGYDCAAARNRIVLSAQKHEADYILMVDNDVIIPKNTIELFCDDIKSVCLGAYPHRGPDNRYTGRTCVGRLYDPDGIAYFNYPIEAEYTSAELISFEQDKKYKIQIHGGGMGCAFIRTSIFDEMSYPWYSWINYNDKSVLSEDLYFCEQCKHAGIPIYTDTRIRCKHILRHAQECE